MQTRSSSRFFGEPSTNPTSTILKRHNRRRSIQRVEPFSLVDTPVVTMADQRSMAKLLRAPTEGYAEAIVVPPILAEHFELKHSLINLVTSKQFFGFEKEDPHAHIRYFNKISSTLKYKDVPETSIKLVLFHFLSMVQPGFGSTKNLLILFSLGMILCPRTFSELRKRLTRICSELKQRLTGICSELKQRLTGIYSELKQRLTGTFSELKQRVTEAGGKERPPMLAPGNYVQWKSRIKRYIDTKPNNELIHYCL
ncbi:hypothetical protein Tco_1389510 [Tanacetum coccineum]